MDDLNKWLDKVERQIAQQDVLSEDFDALRSQIQAMKVGNIISGSIGMASRFLYIYMLFCCLDGRSTRYFKEIEGVSLCFSKLLFLK